MRLVLQRVKQAKVEVEGKIVGEIGPGLLVFLAVEQGDGSKDADDLVEKIVHLRVFEDSQGKMNRSALEAHGEFLVVSQFTLLGDCRKGRRPSFDRAADPRSAEAMYDHFVEQLKGQNVKKIATGRFRAMMDVSLVNDGPVTFILESNQHRAKSIGKMRINPMPYALCSKHTIMTTIDTHAHLDHLENLDEALRNAHESGVTGIVTVGVDMAANKRNLEIKRKTTSPQIYVALGIHPGNIHPAEIDECVQFIREHIQEAIAIGETGLDYWYQWVKKDEAKKEEQRDVFRRQLALAREFALPIIIHSRGAWKDCLQMTKDAGISKAVFHWYSGPLDILKEIIDAGYYVGTTPSLAYSPQSREAINHAPLERILIETDCPVFFQDDQGGFKSQPRDVFRTLKAYVQLKDVDEQKALVAFNQNAKEFFNIR